MFESMDDPWWLESHEAPQVRLSDLLPAAHFVSCDDIVAAGCHDDPDRCGPGDVFFARLTGRGDGHELVARAIARGIAGVVAERIIPTFGTPLCIVPDTGWALARTAHALAGDPAGAMKLIAITGTSGKTTTAWLAASVLAEAGLRVGVLSDLGCLDADATDPEPADLERPEVLAGWLRRLAAGGCSHAVVEVSSRMLASHVLAGIECDTVVVTNLATAHLESHGTMEAYHEIKARILDGLSPNGCIVGNSDDERVRRLVSRHTGQKMTVGLKSDADLTAIPVERGLFGQTVLLRAGGHVAPLSLSTPVASFTRDALFAAAIGLRYRVALERVARGIEAAGCVSGRMERIDRGQEMAVFLDRPTSGHALATTLASLRRLAPGRLVLIAEEHVAASLGEGCRFTIRASRWCDETVVVPGAVLDEQADNEAVAAYARVDRLLSSLGEGDCVLVLGDPPGLQGGPGGPSDPGDPAGCANPRFSLFALVDGWLQLAHPPSWDRRAA